tara:strand:+ start:130 stop:423 length:294 start_codon:yes stop_codon:yes gene_type:complete
VESPFRDTDAFAECAAVAYNDFTGFDFGCPERERVQRHQRLMIVPPKRQTLHPCGSDVQLGEGLINEFRVVKGGVCRSTGVHLVKLKEHVFCATLLV